ncbi:MAG: SMP-30/gluconolactonase/LRE family protein [Acidobacteriota bacterium]
MKFTATRLAFAVAFVGLVVFLLLPSPIDPAAYDPPTPPEMKGALAPNSDLRQAERLAEREVQGPEDVAVDDRGRIYVGTEDGRIVRLDSEGGNLETFATTDGRPLGLHFDALGRLVVADAAKGLLRIDSAGVIEVLSRRADNLPFRFTDDLDIASDGRIYFSDASSRFDHHHYLHDLLEARPHGRLLRFDPATGATEVLLDGLYFANGVALSQAEDFVLVNETYRYRITRYWLTGDRAGESDIFADNLPGFPDGVSANRRGTFWAALFTVRNPSADRLHPRPRVKSLLAKLPRLFWPKPAPYGLVIGYDEGGNIIRTLQDPGGEIIPQVTSAEEVDGQLYLGNLDRDFLARVSL